MGWISNLLANRELARLEELARAAPAPSVFLRLGQIYRQQGDEERAQQIARKGAELFPDNADLSAARADAERASHDVQKTRLRARIEQFPNPSLYAKLAGLHLRDGERDACLRVCEESLRSFPRYGGAYLVLAQVAFADGDPEAGYEHLKQAIALDKFNYMALMMLAEEHLRRGERDEARAVLQSILEFAPGDEKASEMLQDFDAVAERCLRERQNRTPTERVHPGKKTATVAAVSEPAPTPQPAAAGGTGRYAAALDALMATDGVEGALLIDRLGLVVASRNRDGAEIDEEMAGALVTNILRASGSATDAFGLGRMEEGILESEAGCAYLMDLDETAVAVFGQSDAKPGLLQQAVHAFARAVVESD